VAGRRDTPAHEAVAFAGWLFVVLGLVGLIFWRELYVLWVLVIGFGVAALPRALFERLRTRRRGRR
jgi:cyanate permease